MTYNIPPYAIPRTSVARHHYALAEFAGILLPPLAEYIEPEVNAETTEHVLESDNLIITQEQTLAIHNSEHVLKSQIITWVPDILLIINSSDHNLESENIVLIQYYQFSVHNTEHNLESTNVYLPSSTINLYLWGISTSHILSIQMIPTGEIQKIL